MRIIGHLDMDAFFAAIEERDNPRWRGMPIVVGSDPKDGRGRGVVSTASYAARRYGIRSALPITKAWRLSQEAAARGEPAAIFLPVNGRRYGQVSHRIMDIISRYAPTIEQASVDEAYLDLSHHRTFTRAAVACRRLKREIFKEEGLTCSIGLARNKTLAKISSDFKKPDGLTVVLPKDSLKFLAPLDIRKLPGIGPKTEVQLKRHSITTVGQLQALSEADLWAMLGEWGLSLYEEARGSGDDELVTEWTAKSIGEQETFDEDTLDSRLIAERLDGMADSVMRQFKRDGFASFRRFVLIVRFADFTTVTRSHMLPKPATSAATLKTEMIRMLLPFFDRRENPNLKKLRLVGIRVENLA